MPSHWGRQQVLEAQIKTWLETNTVNVALVGLRLSVSDAAVLGSIALLVFAYYFCMSLRRENHEVGSLLREMRTLTAPQRHRLLIRIRATSVLSGPESDEPITTLGLPGTSNDAQAMSRQILFGRVVLAFLTFLPVITIGVVISSDLYFAFVDLSPQRQNFGSAWVGLPDQYKWQLGLMDVFAAIVGILIFNFCRYAAAYRRGTESVTTEFASIRDNAQ